MLRSRHRPLQLSVFVTVLIAIIQLTLDRVNLLLLIGERFASVVDEDRATVPILGLRNLSLEIEPALL
jgi:hypothetical protein